MEDMNDILSPALEKCSKIQEQCKLQEDECLQLAKLASVKADETDGTRIATQVAGGLGSGVALAGATAGVVTAVGVVGSVVAGVFTLGIGTVVGLAATAGGVAAVLGTAGISGAAVTAYSANSLYNTSETLRKLSKDSQAMSKNATSFGSEVIELQASIEKAVTALKSLKRRGTQPDMKEDMIVVTCQTLDRLNKSVKCLSESVQTCKEIFKDLEKQLKEINVEI
jgi:prefoldin subunit 5